MVDLHFNFTYIHNVCQSFMCTPGSVREAGLDTLFALRRYAWADSAVGGLANRPLMGLTVLDCVTLYPPLPIWSHRYREIPLFNGHRYLRGDGILTQAFCKYGAHTPPLKRVLLWRKPILPNSGFIMFEHRTLHIFNFSQFYWAILEKIPF